MQIVEWADKWMAKMENVLAANQKQRLAKIKEKFSKEVTRREVTLLDIRWSLEFTLSEVEALQKEANRKELSSIVAVAEDKLQNVE